jgi:hypothetical protein
LSGQREPGTNRAADVSEKAVRLLAAAGREEFGWPEIAPNIPFGGVKGSGIGRNCGQVGLDAYAELKTVIVHKDPVVS